MQATLLSFPIACFFLTLLADVAYWQSANLLWKTFAEWLLFAGLVGGALAALAILVDIVAHRAARGAVWLRVLVNIAVLALAFGNSLVHARDGWNGVVPWGLALSAATVLLMIVSGFLARAGVSRGVHVHA